MAQFFKLPLLVFTLGAALREVESCIVGMLEVLDKCRVKKNPSLAVFLFIVQDQPPHTAGRSGVDTKA